MIPMPSEWRKSSLTLFAAAAVAGCTSNGFVTEHPVENQIPPLKAGVYTIDAVDVRPFATHQVEPDYPFDLESILTGNAVVVFTVRADGKVADASIVSADDSLFGDAAVAAIRKWLFRPAQVKGAPVDCRMTLPFVFVAPYPNYLPGDSMPEPSDKAPPGGSQQGTIESR
jgi:TonB family protein